MRTTLILSAPGVCRMRVRDGRGECTETGETFRMVVIVAFEGLVENGVVLALQSAAW